MIPWVRRVKINMVGERLVGPSIGGGWDVYGLWCIGGAWVVYLTIFSNHNEVILTTIKARKRAEL